MKDETTRLERVTALRLMLTVGLLAAAGCNNGNKRLVLMTPYSGPTGAIFAGAVLQGHGCDLNIHWENFPREDDLRHQLAKFDQVSQRKLRAVAIAPIQIQALRNPIERASSEGLPVIVIGEDLSIRNRNIAYVLTDERVAGQLAARKLAELLNGRGTVAVTGLDFSKPSNVQRDQGFEQELADRFSEIRVVARRSGTINLFQEQKAVDDLLNSFQDLDAIVALNGSSTRGAFYALKTRPVHLQVHLIGFDQGLVAPLSRREIDAIVAVPSADIGKTVASLVCDRLAGKNWAGPYVLPPVLLLPDNLRNKDVQDRVFGGAWWDGEE